ncbi:MAG: hypothetical protein GY800_00405 [Planctomycetes bacterium]|nr:hypothetical protein [Planctomycetota bacterium]
MSKRKSSRPRTKAPGYRDKPRPVDAKKSTEGRMNRRTAPASGSGTA